MQSYLIYLAFFQLIQLKYLYFPILLSITFLSYAHFLHFNKLFRLMF